MPDLAQRIQDSLANMTEPLLLTEPNSPGLRKRFERQARAILEGFVRCGEVTGFHVAVDAGPVPTIQVTYREPKRVKAVVLRVGPTDG